MFPWLPECLYDFIDHCNNEPFRIVLMISLISKKIIGYFWLSYDFCFFFILNSWIMLLFIFLRSNFYALSLILMALRCYLFTGPDLRVVSCLYALCATDLHMLKHSRERFYIKYACIMCIPAKCLNQGPSFEFASVAHAMCWNLRKCVTSNSGADCCWRSHVSDLIHLFSNNK